MAWMADRIGEYTYQANVYDFPSAHGINSGRICRLWVFDRARRATVADYDRGWNKEPADAAAREVVARICALWK